MADQFAPWLEDPDDPADIPTPADPGAAAKAIFAMFPELIDHSNDGPIKPETEAQRIERVRNNERHRHIQRTTEALHRRFGTAE
jgi:hypothetical protein